MAKRKKDKRVPVLLLEDIVRVGNRGEIKKLKMGYALFLVRKNQGIIVNPKKIDELPILRNLALKRLEEKTKFVEEIKTKINNLVFQTSLKVGEHGEVYNSITKEKIKKFLEENGIAVEKNDILLDEPIREKGEYEVEINVGLGEKAILKILVEEEKIK
ncbi:MAG: 50S ribosomal protein L9 [Candidatus Aenigmatarchaeota archaeon]